MSLYIPEVKIPQDKQSILMWLSSDGTVAYYVGTYPKLGGEVKAIEIPDHGNLIDREAFRKDMDNHYPFDRYTQSSHGTEDVAKSKMIQLLSEAEILIPAEGMENDTKG